MPSIDAERLDKLRQLGGDRLVTRMIDLFTANGPQRIETARSALASGDMQSAERAVHSLKSSAANVGAQTLREIAQQAEDQAAARHATLLPTLLDALEAELQRVCVILAGRRVPPP